MFAIPVLAAALAGGYTVEDALVTVEDGKATVQCFRVDRELALTVEGPASFELVVRAEGKARAKRHKPLTVSVTVDGAKKKKRKRLKLKPNKKARYSDGLNKSLSRPGNPIPVEVGAGKHTVSIALPARRSACIEVSGIELVTPDPEPVVAAERMPPPPSGPPVNLAEPPAEPPVETTAVAGADAEATSVQDPQLAAIADGSTVAEEIHAVGISEPGAPEEPASASSTPTEVRDLFRIGVMAGGVLPRGDLQGSFYVGLLAEVPFVTLGVELSGYVQAGWTPMRQQDTVLIEGRGQAGLIQETLTIPMELGLRARLDLGLPVVPFAAVALALDYSRTELSAFSLPPQTHQDIGVGVAAALGVAIPLGPGAILGELRYREVGTDLGSLDSVAESTLSSGAFYAGYVFGF